MKKPCPYFRFSKYHCPWDIAQSWLEHFKRHDIPAAILQNDAGFSVWIIGKENLAYDGWTALQRGRDLYVGQACWHCHSQYVRVVSNEEQRCSS